MKLLSVFTIHENMNDTFHSNQNSQRETQSVEGCGFSGRSRESSLIMAFSFYIFIFSKINIHEIHV